MYVYIWKDAQNIPFYVGMGKTMRRPNPGNKNRRNETCLQKLFEIGTDAVIVEIHTVATPDAAKALEQQFIAKYGRLKNGTGTLTNISKGGEYHASSPEVRAKLQQLWQDPVYIAAQRVSRTGKKHKLSPKTRAKLATSLRANPAMKGWSERNGKDPAFDAKRVAGIKAAQPSRREKMMAPAALAQRKARLKETMNSEAYKAKRAQRNTPEYREKLSAARRAYWEKRRTQELMGPSLVA